MRPISRNLECVEDAQAAIYRRKSPRERLHIAFGLWSSTWTVLTGLLRSQHPDWEDEKIRKEVARRMSHGAI
jgi:hypothetical protein